MSLESKFSPMTSLPATAALASFSSSMSKLTEFSFGISLSFAVVSSLSGSFLLKSWMLLMGTFFMLPFAIKNISLFLIANILSGKKSWLGPERIFAIKNKEIFLIANGSIKKVPRSNIQLLSKNEPDNDDTTANDKEIPK